MAASRSSQELAEIASFVRRLYELGGFATWKEFSDHAGVLPPQVSNFQRGVAEPSGLNLLALIQASAIRQQAEAAETALLVARETQANLLAEAVLRLERLEALVSQLPTAATLESAARSLQAAIDAQATPGRSEDPPAATGA